MPLDTWARALGDHLIGDSLGPKAGMGPLRGEESSFPLQESGTFPQSALRLVTILTELFWLHFHGGKK
jgi:hypothetical protein